MIMKEYLLSYFGDLNTECYFGIVTDFWFSGSSCCLNLALQLSSLGTSLHCLILACTQSEIGFGVTDLNLA